MPDQTLLLSVFAAITGLLSVLGGLIVLIFSPNWIAAGGGLVSACTGAGIILASGYIFVTLKTKKSFSSATVTTLPSEVDAPIGEAENFRPEHAARSTISRSAAVRSFDVSIVIPTYNEGVWLRRTLDAILTAKTDLRFEVIVVDDGCTDGSTTQIPCSAHVRLVTSTPSKRSGLIVSKSRRALITRAIRMFYRQSHLSAGPLA